MRAPRTLSARLVVTVVVLVAVISAIIAAITTVAVRSQQLRQLDANVLSAVGRVGDREGDQNGRGDAERSTGGRSDRDGSTRRPPPEFSNQGPGTLVAIIEPGSAVGDSSGIVLTRALNGRRSLSATDLARLAEVPADGKVHAVDLPALGGYRVAAALNPTGSRRVSGLPTRDVDETVGSLIGYELLLTLLGVVVAAGLGTLLVRRELRPLNQVAQTAHTVAALPLAHGAIDLTERVPERLTDERTEVGQMGAALNTLLSHIESSLEARHRSEQQVRQFVGDASHELRTPLATIHGYAELARRTPGDATALSSALAKVETEADRMSGLVEDLLLLARLDSGRALERVVVDVTRLLLETVADARVIAPDHRWHLDLPEQPVTVLGDEQRLHQVVANLLGNARQHTPPGTTVTVSARSTPEGVLIEVHDDGPGLPPGLEEHVFERFTRGDSSRTRASGGAGLGLSMVAAIAQAHGGAATVRSVPGDTAFAVLLPS